LLDAVEKLDGAVEILVAIFVFLEDDVGYGFCCAISHIAADVVYLIRHR